MWPITKNSASSAAEATDIRGPPLDLPWHCMGDAGTLSVLLAFAFLVSVFVLFVSIDRCRGVKRSRRRGLYTDSGGIMEWIEDTFVSPFVPASLEQYVVVIFIIWFVFTVPMGITRYYTRAWKVEMFGQHQLFNFIGFLMGW